MQCVVFFLLHKKTLQIFLMWWFTLSQKTGTHTATHSFCLLPHVTGKEQEKQKQENLMDQDKNYLTGKGKRKVKQV